MPRLLVRDGMARLLAAGVDGTGAAGVAGAQFGASMGTRLRGEETRALLGLLVLGVALSLLWGLLRRPENLFSAGPAW